MSLLPTARDLGLPAGALIAVPADGLVVFRLVRSDPPTDDDFRPRPHRRAHHSWPEILQLGVSHFLSEDGAEGVRRHWGSSVAKVTLRPNRGIHLARTGRADHVTVWARIEELVEMAEVVR